MEKIITRNCAKFIRSRLNIPEISRSLIFLIRELEEYKSANVVMLYYPKSDELDLRLLAEDNKTFCLPRMEDGCICPCLWQAEEELQSSYYGIKEPITKEFPRDNIDLIIMPGLCADLNRNRLGYGRGCYDMFLEKCCAKSLFPLPDELLFDNIPSDIYDKKPDIILTPLRMIG